MRKSEELGVGNEEFMGVLLCNTFIMRGRIL